MPSRRFLLQTFSAGAAALIGGCIGNAQVPQTQRSNTPSQINETEPIRTEGTRARFCQQRASETSIEHLLEQVIADSAPCLEGRVPISSFDSGGLLIRTETVVERPVRGNIMFPSPAYHHLKDVVPSSLVIASDRTSEKSEQRIPVYIKGILRYGNGKNIPYMPSEC